MSITNFQSDTMKVFLPRHFLPVFLFFQILFSPAFAQPSSPPISPKAKLFYDQSQQYILERKFDQAISLLEKSIEREPNFAEAHFRLANVYELKAYVERGKDYSAMSTGHYEKSVELKPKNPSFIGAYSILGGHYLDAGNYAKAKDAYGKFLSMRPTKQAQVLMAQRQIANCDFAVEAMKNPLPYQANPMSGTVNKFMLQYFPVLTADQQTIIFTARTSAEPKSDENIYTSSRKGGDWTEPTPLSPRINTAENEGASSISADGRMLVFTCCDGRQTFGGCDLYVTYKFGGEWTEPINLGNKINSPFWESQPSLSADGRTLYFASDRRGGYGKRDLWVSRLSDDGQWGVASNLGSKINTPEDDLSPFIHVNGRTLFFSSEGQIGMGGFDLFYSEFDKNAWAVAKNLGYPLNTQDDQVSLFVSADGKKGYFAHEERQGGRFTSSKLYEFDFPEQIAVKHKSNYMKGVVYDARTKKPVEARIELFNLNGGELETVMQSDRKDGSYLTVLTEGASYGLYANREGYLFKSLYFDYSGSKNNEPLVMDIYLQPLEKGAKDVLNNLFFDTGKYALEDKSKTELQKLVSLLKDNKNLRLEISGHTDDVGKDSDNLALSLKRAKSVYDHLAGAGIGAGRLTFVGYGETQFAVQNTSDKNRQLNRRIEFKVL